MTIENAVPTKSASPVSSAPASSSPAPVTSQAVQTGGQKPAATSVPQKGWDYKSDARWGKVPNGTEEQNKGKIWASEADIIEGYHSLEDVHEKKYKPAFQRMSDLEKKFAEGKLDINKIDEYLKNYNELSNPENPKNQLWAYLNETIVDPVTAQDFQNYMKKLTEEKLARRFPGMTQEQREAAIQRDKELSELRSKISSIDHEKAVNSNLQLISKQEKSIRELCANKGFEFTDNIKNEFWQFCREEVQANRMTLDQMNYAFLMKYGSELDKAYENKIKSGMIEQQRTQKATTVTFARKPVVNGNEKLPFRDRLGNAMEAFKQTAKT